MEVSANHLGVGFLPCGPRLARRVPPADRSMLVVAAVVLEHESHHGVGDERHRGEEQPPAEHEPQRAERRAAGEGERPPTVWREEPEIPGAIGDLSGRVVLWTWLDPPGREEQVEADEEAQREGEHQRRRARWVV